MRVREREREREVNEEERGQYLGSIGMEDTRVLKERRRKVVSFPFCAVTMIDAK